MPSKRLGRVLRTLREEKGWTQEELAGKARVARSYLTKLETDARVNPTIAVLKRLAKALRVPVTELLE